MMRSIVLTVLGLIALGVFVLAGGALVAYDWDEPHAKATAALPVLGSQYDDLVRIRANEFEFRARLKGFDGDRDGVILLHGFPETSAMWEPLIDALAERGHPVVAFDQRGYSPGARPDAIEDYQPMLLVQDVVDVANAADFERFHLVGHDWGAIVGWGVAMTVPERVRTFTALSVPHPKAFLEAMTNDDDQRERSGYVGFFRTPWLPELVFAFNDLAALRGLYRSMPDAQRDEYLSVFAEPGAMTSALNWYRAMDIGPGLDRLDPAIVPPVLFIWGNRDQAIGRAGVESQRAFMPADFTEVELDVSHWIIQEAQARVIDEVLALLATH